MSGTRTRRRPRTRREPPPPPTGEPPEEGLRTRRLELDGRKRVRPRSVLVTDGRERSALAVVRALGEAGHRPYVCSCRPRPLAGASRHAAGVARITDPAEDVRGMAHDVESLAEHWGVDLVLPMTDPSLTALLPLRRRLPGLARLFPDLGAYRRVSDKARLMDVAPEVGFAVPEGRVLEAPAELPGRGGLGLPYPVVVKSTRSVVRHDGRLVWSPGATLARDREALERTIRSLPRTAFPVLVQERIEGEGRGIFLLRRDGSNLAVFAHRRVREKPPTGGVSVCRESVAADPELVARSSRLLDRLDWDGVAMVELKRQAGSGEAYLMEVNPRLWGSLQLAVDAGVDFPNLLLDAATGTLDRPVREYRPGVRCRWWWGEVDHLLGRVLHGVEDAVAPGAPGRWRTAADLLTPSRSGNRTEVLRFSDPGPFLRETRQWMAGL